MFDRSTLDVYPLKTQGRIDREGLDPQMERSSVRLARRHRGRGDIGATRVAATGYAGRRR
jgi:hypothetical protein